MNEPAPKTKIETAEKILDIGEYLIQTRGYNDISYQDISDELGIRKASIHYHFPSKSDLGFAVMKRYRERLEAAIAGAGQDDRVSNWELLEFYFSPYFQFAETPDKVCLSGSLAGEFPTLPPDMQKLVAAFFHEHQKWLTALLTRGRDSGEFAFDGSAEKLARVLFNALQGALIVKRASGDIQQLHDVTDVFRAMLKPKTG